MNDDVRAALDDLVQSADLQPLPPAAARAEAAGRRRRRRLVSGSLVAVVLLAAPLAWSAVPERGDDVVVEDTADQPPVGEPTGRLVSGSFELTYDGRRYDDSSDAALTSCDGLPGLRNTGFQLDSSPPIRSFFFAGTSSQQDAAARCLRAMPAAIVTFEEDAYFVPVVGRDTDLQAPGRLTVQTSRLRPAPGGWLEHDLIFINHGEESLALDPESLAEVMGGSIAASTGSCSATAGGGFACQDNKTDRVLAPGESAVTTVELERDVPGLAAVEPGTQSLTWTQEVTRPGGDPMGELSLTLTYDVLTAARSAVLDAVPRPPGETQAVKVFFMSTEQDGPQSYCNQVVAVPRQVPVTAAVATAALNELFRGPSPQEERDLEVGSAFARETADLLRSVRVEDGVAYVDLRSFDDYAGTGSQLGSYGTSCGSVAFHAQVEATLTQFPTVREVRFAFDGDPGAFVEYMQGVCPDPVPAGDPCDPGPFR